jgi:hypothetical protein
LLHHRPPERHAGLGLKDRLSDVAVLAAALSLYGRSDVSETVPAEQRLEFASGPALVAFELAQTIARVVAGMGPPSRHTMARSHQGPPWRLAKTPRGPVPKPGSRGAAARNVRGGLVRTRASRRIPGCADLSGPVWREFFSSQIQSRNWSTRSIPWSNNLNCWSRCVRLGSGFLQHTTEDRARSKVYGSVRGPLQVDWDILIQRAIILTGVLGILGLQAVSQPDVVYVNSSIPRYTLPGPLLKAPARHSAILEPI